MCNSDKVPMMMTMMRVENGKAMTKHKWVSYFPQISTVGERKHRRKLPCSWCDNATIFQDIFTKIAMRECILEKGQPP